MITLGARCVAVLPPASETEVVCALPADVVVAEVVVEELCVWEGGRAVEPLADKGVAAGLGGRRRGRRGRPG